MLVWIIGVILLILSLSIILLSIYKTDYNCSAELENFDFDLNKILEKKYCA